MKYMSVYVEVISDATDGEIRKAVLRGFAGLTLTSLDGAVVGQVAHVQVTDGPAPTWQGSV